MPLSYLEILIISRLKTPWHASNRTEEIAIVGPGDVIDERRLLRVNHPVKGNGSIKVGASLDSLEDHMPRLVVTFDKSGLTEKFHEDELDKFDINIAAVSELKVLLGDCVGDYYRYDVVCMSDVECYIVKRKELNKAIDQSKYDSMIEARLQIRDNNHSVDSHVREATLATP